MGLIAIDNCDAWLFGGPLTPRGSVFKPNHAWSIQLKKRKSNERFYRENELKKIIRIDVLNYRLQ
jgi:hypothetical protein